MLQSLQFTVDDFVLAEYIYCKHQGAPEEKRLYVCQVKKVMKKNIILDCMRPYMGRKDMFCFPHIRDIDDEATPDMIVRVLPPPRIARDRYQFCSNVF